MVLGWYSRDRKRKSQYRKGYPRPIKSPVLAKLASYLSYPTLSNKSYGISGNNAQVKSSQVRPSLPKLTSQSTTSPPLPYNILTLLPLRPPMPAPIQRIHALRPRLFPIRSLAVLLHLRLRIIPARRPPPARNHSLGSLFALFLILLALHAEILLLQAFARWTLAESACELLAVTAAGVRRGLDFCFVCWWR